MQMGSNLLPPDPGLTWERRRQSIMQFSCQKSEQKKIREAEVFD
jgi:hypothetical protein